MMEEEGTVIVGMLVGLNVIDANLCIKGEDLDSQVSDEYAYVCMPLAVYISPRFSQSGSGVRSCLSCLGGDHRLLLVP